MRTKTLSHSASGAIRQFAFWVANGTVALPLLEGHDYRSILLREPGAMERIFAIFANVLALDHKGNVTNAKAAEYRAGQWLRAYVDHQYTAEPAFEDWELALH